MMVADKGDIEIHLKIAKGNYGVQTNYIELESKNHLEIIQKYVILELYDIIYNNE